MRILISLSAADCKGWLQGLARSLAQAGHEVGFSVTPGATPEPCPSRLALALEKRLFRGTDATLWAPLDQARLPQLSGAPDVHVSLSGDAAADLLLRLNDSTRLNDLPGIIMGDCVPWLAFASPQGNVLASGVPALEDPDSLLRSLAGVTNRIGTLLLMALDGQAGKRQPAEREPCATPGNAMVFVARALLRKAAPKLMPGRFRKEHWRIGIRKRPFTGAFQCTSTVEGFTWLPDDGQRYYADPILFDEGDRTFLFMEEFPYALGRGIISVTELAEDGTILYTPRPVLERKGHLSYPLLFRHDGEIYMMPENAEEGHVPLYRARRFPDEWEELAPVLNVALHDATLVQRGEHYWILGNAALNGGSSWDCLMAYRADDPRGPYCPHPANPLMLDARATRPGGPVFMEKGLLVRTVQDCLKGYGRFKRFYNIDQLDMDGFSQHERGQWRPPEGGGVVGVHTFSRSRLFHATDARASLNEGRARA